MNIKNRTLGTVSLVIFFLTVFFLCQGISQHNETIETLINSEKKQIDTIVDDITTCSLSPYPARIKHIIDTHPEISQAFAAKDRLLLHTLASNQFDSLLTPLPYRYTLLFNLPDGTVFLTLRPPAPEDGISANASHPLWPGHQTRKPTAGFAISEHGVTYRITHPIFSEDAHIGDMEFDIPAQQVIDAISKRLHTEVAMLLDAAAWKKSAMEQKGLRFFADAVLIADNNSSFAQIPGSYNFADNHHQIVIDGRTNLLHSSSVLKDYQGKTLGRILIRQDIAEKLARKRVFAAHSIMVGTLLLGLALLAVYFTTKSLVGRLEQYAAENRQARQEIQHAHDALEIRVKARTSELANANSVLLKEVADRIQAESKLVEQREFLQNIIESLTHPFYVIDARTHAIVLANKAAYALTDRSHEGLTCHAMTHNRDTPCTGEEHTCALAEVKKTKRPAMVEHFHSDHGSGGGYFEIHAYPLFDEKGEVKQVIEYNIDITERKKADEDRRSMWAQLLQSQKMEAIGVLAGGVAHDFNNILTSIIGNAQLAMLKGSNAAGDIQKYLDQIMGSSERAVGLVRQLLLFSRRQVSEEFGAVNLNKTISNILNMLKRLIGEDITISVELTPEVWTVNADEGNIEQTITNLVVNARDAMPDGGKIIISTKNLDIDHLPEGQPHNSRLGNYVILSIADTGVGIGPEDIKQIFDPFYTTKPTGKGTGLGLSIVNGIVKQHDGWINVYSEPGQGTVFNIYLPALTEQEEQKTTENMTEWPAIATEPVTGEGQVILLLEDEEDVREVAIKILTARGFQVLAAADTETARIIFDRERERIDLFFSDVALPDGNGVKLAQEFLAQAPQLKILMTSGYPDHRSRLGIIREQKLHFIQKPYGVVDLEKALRETLQR